MTNLLNNKKTIETTKSEFSYFFATLMCVNYVWLSGSEYRAKGAARPKRARQSRLKI